MTCTSNLDNDLINNIVSVKDSGFQGIHANNSGTKGGLKENVVSQIKEILD